jgi:putative transposase
MHFYLISSLIPVEYVPQSSHRCSLRITSSIEVDKEQFERRYWLKAQGYDINRVAQKVAEVVEIALEEIWKPGNQPLRVKTRSLICYWAVRELGMSGTRVGKQLGLGQPAVSRAVARGKKLAQDMNLSLKK